MYFRRATLERYAAQLEQTDRRRGVARRGASDKARTWLESNDGAGVAPTVATITEALAGVEPIDVDALSDNEGTAGATNATDKEETVAEVVGGAALVAIRITGMIRMRRVS